ncbi:MAG: RNA chaperone Hfq [Spirochaetales bacterium]|nr:RNA chaperone Hfq [Spirochaetales bacterium]
MRSQNQDVILATAIERQKPLTFFLRNGVHVKGKVIGHDAFTVLVETDKHQSLVFKHSITSIQPAHLPRPERKTKSA